MYVSDYAYATNINGCDTISLLNWNNDCKNNSWLFDVSYPQWTINHGSDEESGVFIISGIDLSWGNGYRYSAHNNFLVRAVIYLKSNIKIKSGTGANDDPYILGT